MSTPLIPPTTLYTLPCHWLRYFIRIFLEQIGCLVCRQLNFPLLCNQEAFAFHLACDNVLLTQCIWFEDDHHAVAMFLQFVQHSTNVIFWRHIIAYRFFWTLIVTITIRQRWCYHLVFGICRRSLVLLLFYDDSLLVIIPCVVQVGYFGCFIIP